MGLWWSGVGFLGVGPPPGDRLADRSVVCRTWEIGVGGGVDFGGVGVSAVGNLGGASLLLLGFGGWNVRLA